MDQPFWQRRLSRRRTLGGAAAGMAALAAACGGTRGRQSGSSAPSSGQAAAGKPRAGGKITTYRNVDIVTGFDPYGASAFSVDVQSHMTMVYDTLVGVGVGAQYAFDDRTVKPQLAASWEQPDDQTYVFHLRPGIKWHDKPPVNGRELVADDVKFSFDRLQQSNFGYKTLYQSIQTVEANDPRTVTLKTGTPDAPLMDRLALGFAWIIAKDAGKPDAKGALGLSYQDAEAAIGTGPFILEQWQKQQSVSYRRNPNYFEQGVPYLDALEYRIVPDNATAVSLLQTGQLDVGSIPQASQQQIRTTAPKIKVLEPYNNKAFHRSMRVDQPPFNDVRVRRAVAMAHNQSELAASWGTPDAPHAFGGAHLSGSDGYLPLNQLGDAAKWWQPNLNDAKQLLAAAGLANGLDTVYSGSAAVQDIEQSELFVSQMAKVGIRVKLNIQPHPEYLASTAVGKFEGMGIWAVDEYQADDFFSQMVPGAAKNVGHVDDPKLTDLVKKQRTTMDAKQRQATLQEIARYLADQVYAASFPQLLGFVGVQPYVQNYQPHLGYPNVFKVTWVNK